MRLNSELGPGGHRRGKLSSARLKDIVGPDDRIADVGGIDNPIVPTRGNLIVGKLHCALAHAIEHVRTTAHEKIVLDVNRPDDITGAEWVDENVGRIAIVHTVNVCLPRRIKIVVFNDIFLVLNLVKLAGQVPYYLQARIFTLFFEMRPLDLFSRP